MTLEDRGKFTCRGGPMEGRVIGVSGLLCGFSMRQDEWRYHYEPDVVTMEYTFVKAVFVGATTEDPSPTDSDPLTSGFQ